MAVLEQSLVVRKRVDEWKKRLIDLSRRNQLVFYKRNKGANLEISSPNVEEVFKSVFIENNDWKFYLPDESATLESREEEVEVHAATNEFVCGKLEKKTIEKNLLNLYRKSKEEYEERGVKILHLVFGMLCWQEKENTEVTNSPLLLCPVELTRNTSYDPFELHLAEEELILNPALQVKLKNDFNITFPVMPDNIDDEGILSYFAELQTCLTDTGWSVELVTALGAFSFEKMGMYNDLEKNIEHLEGSGCVRALCGEEFLAESIGEFSDQANLDRLQKPQDTFQILDADSSQQQCIQAVLNGQSVVLQGPPGTGKSQTIANITAEFMARGKTVLFVSEKMAALEVVAKRLNDAGLGDFCLELHSRKANKREVISELHKCLEYMLKPRVIPSQEDFQRLSDVREKLNDYATAIHEKCSATGCSAFEGISRSLQNPSLPAFSLGVDRLDHLGPEHYRQWSDLIRQLFAVWSVAEEMDQFPWLGCKEEQYNTEIATTWSQNIQLLIDSLATIISLTDTFSVVTGSMRPKTLQEVAWLIEVAHHIELGIVPNATWLTTNEMDDVLAEAQRYRQLTAEYVAIAHTLRAKYKEEYFTLASNSGENLREEWNQVNVHLLLDASGEIVVSKRGELLKFTNKQASFVQECIELSHLIGNAIGYSSDGFTADKAKKLSRSILICHEEHKPEASWLNTKKYKDIVQLIAEVKPTYEQYVMERNEILSKYDDTVFELDIDSFLEKFQRTTYRSFLKLLNPQYYNDKKEIIRCTKDFKMPDDIVGDLLKVRNIQKLQKKIDDRVLETKDLFGTYYNGYATNFAALTEGMGYALEMMKLLDGEEVPAGIIHYLDSDHKVPQNIVTASSRLHELICDWQQQVEYLSDIVSMDSMEKYNRSIHDLSDKELLQWVDEMQPPVSHLCRSLDRIDSLRIESGYQAINQVLGDLSEKQRYDEIQELIIVESERLKEKFGERFQGLNTTWDELLIAIEWTIKLRELYEGKTLSTEFIEFLSLGKKATVLAHEMVAPYHEFIRDFTTIIDDNFVESTPTFNGMLLKNQPLFILAERLKSMSERVSDLENWIDYKKVGQRLEVSGLGKFLANLEKQPPKAQDLMNVFTKSFYKTQMELLFQQDARLQDFRGKHHEQLIAEFSEIDRKLIEYAPYVIMEQCNARRPSLNGFTASGSEINILKREAAKSRRHMPLIRLFEKIPNLLLRVKPCLMMSPLSVSQFMNPECFHFDLVIFDEASQIFTEDAIVAMYRGNQVVIAGDSKQMPPTNFFRSMDMDDGEPGDDTDELSSADFSSVLDECGTVLPGMMLRWHYRSKHESLIAFSNRQFYDNRLVTFPSAIAKHPELGVHFVHVPDGIYDMGGKRSNAREAQVVADHVFEHFKNSPKKSLGVVAFSQAQMVAIQDELERRRLQNPQYERFFREDRLEGFFVKNLENVQGDERDVIMFSIGFGRDRNGKISMNFGPLNKSGGERRLNVAVTRAKQQIILISSMQGTDIDLTKTNAAGVLNLHHYLNYAEHGESSLSIDHPEGLGEADSPFEEDVAGVIRQMGYQVVLQVGCSGYRIDMGVLDPAEPGKFILGVECDGATYHSSATARDRDRLRQQVLETLGWKFHRIWSPEWFNRREKAIEELKQAIEDARSQKDEVIEVTAEIETSETRVSENTDRVAVAEEEATEPLKGRIEYQPCNLPISALSHIDFHLPECRSEQCRLITEIVNTEGPIHMDLLAKRLAGAWNVAKVGRRIRSAIEEGVQGCSHQGKVLTIGDYVWPKDLEQVMVRVPVDGFPETIRNIEHIPEEEIYGAMLLILEQCVGMQPDALVVETARLFGFSKTGEKIRSRLVDCFDKLQSNGDIVYMGESITLPRADS